MAAREDYVWGCPRGSASIKGKTKVASGFHKEGSNSLSFAPDFASQWLEALKLGEPTVTSSSPSEVEWERARQFASWYTVNQRPSIISDILNAVIIISKTHDDIEDNKISAAHHHYPAWSNY